MFDLPEEKLEVLQHDGDALVIANPGTGKTLLLSHKYRALIDNDVAPDDILCLTFTTEARDEMKSRILDLVDVSPVHVHTFHSYASRELRGMNVVDEAFLRYIVFRELDERDVYNYGRRYLSGTILDAFSHALTYVKSYGVRPGDIQGILDDLDFADARYDEDQLELLAEQFVNVYEAYEDAKEGMDHNDTLLYALEEQRSAYGYVLVDELQDVNRLEALLALRAGETVVGVGDPKQAIFGFQGGSTQNFDLFDGERFALGENYRSKQEVLDYAKAYYSEHAEASKELDALNSATGMHGEEPVVVDVNRDDRAAVAASRAAQAWEDWEKVAVITRTNDTAGEVVDGLEQRGVPASSDTGEGDASTREEIIRFVKGVLSYDPVTVRKALFTPYVDVDVQRAFTACDDDWSIRTIEASSAVLRDARNASSMGDVAKAVKQYVLPVVLKKDEAAFRTARALHTALPDSYIAASHGVDDVALFLENVSVDSASTNGDGVRVMTAHNAKGTEFDSVIYLPKDTNTYQKRVEAIRDQITRTLFDDENNPALENTRLDFVAMTRAREELHIVSDNAETYQNEHSNMVSDVAVDEELGLFEEDTDDEWLLETIKSYISNLSRVSYSALDTRPVYFLEQRVLNISSSSARMDLGSNVHDAIETLLDGEQPDVDGVVANHVDNAKAMIEDIKDDYPEVYGLESHVEAPLDVVIDEDTDLGFHGYIDAVFTNGNEFLLVDWKTGRSTSTKHRRQLYAYKKAFAYQEDVDLDDVDVALGYTGLQDRVNNDEMRFEFDDKQPTKRQANTLRRRWERLRGWEKHPEKLVEAVKGDSIVL